MDKPMLYAQGDILLEPVPDSCGPSPPPHQFPPRRPIVLAHGEATGHTHRIERGAVLFRDDGLARDVPAGLYIGHLVVTANTADLVHQEHDTITLPRGVYRVRRQREFDGDLASEREARLVED